jgi:uncharacterized membrane protein YqjE
MSDVEQRPAGLWASASRLLHTFIQVVESRVELIALEWQEEKLRLVEILVLTSATVFLGGLSLVMVTITIVFVAWPNPQARAMALIVTTLLYIAGAVAAARRLRRLLKDAELPFAESLGQLKKDRTWLDER